MQGLLTETAGAAVSVRVAHMDRWVEDVEKRGRTAALEEEPLTGVFCCDGAGCGGMHDPWCDNAPAAEQEHWFRSKHLGYVDMSIYPPLDLCDDPRCCGEDDDD